MGCFGRKFWKFCGTATAFFTAGISTTKAFWMRWVYVVRGNNDREWAEQLPHDLTVQIEGWKIFMVHNRKEIENLPEDADIVIFGHSHKYFEQVIDGRLWLNPGSCGKRRFGQEISLAVLTVDGKDYQVRKILLPME